MKTTLPFKAIKNLFLLSFLFAATVATAQSELVFQNSTLQSGTAGANNAVYKFSSVNDTTDALVKIVGRSSNLVSLVKIDLSNEGFNKAFQPQVSYNNGSTNNAAEWWMEFEINFVNHTTALPSNISKIYATGLDIDGNNTTLREFNTFYGVNSYTLENGSGLSVSNVTGSLLNLSLTGKKFNGVLAEYPGIDTTKTNVMVTSVYENVSTITLRVGGSTTGSANDTRRKSSIWFKAFPYVNPINTLPVSLVTFIANLNNKKVDLKWTTASEINVSHFIIERSFDGDNFQQAGLVFSNGGVDVTTNYMFPDDISSMNADIIYYRLKMVDLDGKTQLSNVRLVRRGKDNTKTISITVFPNPVSTELKVTIPAEWQNKNVCYQIFSINGAMIENRQTSNSSQTETISTGKLNPGMYILKVVSGNEKAQQRFVKQ